MNKRGLGGSHGSRVKNKRRFEVHSSMGSQGLLAEGGSPVGGGGWRGGACPWRPLPREGLSAHLCLSSSAGNAAFPPTRSEPPPGAPRGRCRARRGGFVPCSGMARLSSPRTRGHASADVRGLGRLVGVACLPRMGCPAEAELCSPSAFEIVHRTFETLGRFINRVANLRL